MTVFINKKNNEGKQISVKVCENYYVNFNEVLSASVRDDCINELEKYIESKENSVKRCKSMPKRKYELLSSDKVKELIKNETEDIEDFNKKTEQINLILRKFAGYGIIANSFDYFNVRNDIGVSIAKENLALLKELKFSKSKMSLSVEDMLKDLKINSED